MARTPFSQWRKIAMATWGRPRDPFIRVTVDLDAANLNEYIAAARARTGEHVTVTHLVGRAAALTISGMDRVNGRILAGMFLPHDSVDVFFLVSTKSSVDADASGAVATDLSGSKVSAVDEKQPWVIAAELAAGARRIRDEDDPAFRRAKELTKRMPGPALRPMMDVLTFLTEILGVSLAPLGLEARPFGTVMVSNVGMFGLESAFAPMPAISHAIGNIIVGEERNKPVAIDAEVVVRPILPLSITVDHRYIDGYQGAILMRELRSYLENPAAHDPLPSEIDAEPGIRSPSHTS